MMNRVNSELLVGSKFLQVFFSEAKTYDQYAGFARGHPPYY